MKKINVLFIAVIALAMTIGLTGCAPASSTPAPAAPEPPIGDATAPASGDYVQFFDGSYALVTDVRVVNNRDKIGWLWCSGLGDDEAWGGEHSVVFLFCINGGGDQNITKLESVNEILVQCGFFGFNGVYVIAEPTYNFISSDDVYSVGYFYR